MKKSDIKILLVDDEPDILEIIGLISKTRAIKWLKLKME